MRSIIKLATANIRHKKSSYIGIAFLIFMIVFSVIPTISNTANTKRSVDESMDSSGIRDACVLIADDLLSDEIRDAVNSYPGTVSVEERSYLSIMKRMYFDGVEKNSIQHLSRYYPSVQVFNDDFTALSEIPPLKPGEILLPYKIKDLDWVRIGAVLEIQVSDRRENFVVKGFYDDPMFRSRTWLDSYGLISCEDFDRLSSDVSRLTDSDRSLVRMIILNIDLDQGTDIKTFREDMEAKCRLESNAYRIMSRDDIRKEGTLYADMGSKMVYIFMALLLGVILICLHSSISSAIEMDYADIGILKSQGFSILDIRLSFVIGYSLSVLLGSVIGVLAAIPLTSGTVRLFMTVTCVLSDNSIEPLTSILLIPALLIICALFVFACTRKISRISPVTAIRGGREDVYFNPSFMTAVKAKPLMLGLSLRRITTSKVRYIGCVLIVSILIFFMISISLLTTGVDVDTLFPSPSGEIVFGSSDIISSDVLSSVEAEAQKFDPEASVHAKGTDRVLIDGKGAAVHLFYVPGDCFRLLDGISPRYDNEILMAQVLADRLGKTIGSKVTIDYRDRNCDYIISGIYDSVYDFGENVAMYPDAASRLGFDSYSECYVDCSEGKETSVIDALSSLPNIYASEYEPDPSFETYKGIINTLLHTITYVIYGVSMVFAAVVVLMICYRSFLEERRDIGIFKAIGFASRSLRFEFSLRFGIVAVIGTLIGTVLAAFLATPMLGFCMRIVGLTDFLSTISPSMVLIPAVIIVGSFMLFAYISSRSVKSVEVRELITE